MPTVQVLDVANNLSEVGHANDTLRQLWASNFLPEEFEPEVAICLEEILSNVIRHGCLPGQDRRIQVFYRIFDSPPGIEIEVVDDARAFDPLSLPPPDLTVPIEQRTVGGLGVLMVRKMMDEVNYEYREGRNHFRFRKNWA